MATIANLRYNLYPINGSRDVAYMIYPDTDNIFPDNWLTSLATKHNVNIAIIYIPLNRWNDMLTPWPEPSEASGPSFTPFAGDAAETIKMLQTEIIPQVEAKLNLTGEIRRNLIGVSLSGLFILWQWILYPTFHSIACLSGSFWYTGFLNWFNNQTIPKKDGKAYFLLGKQEPKAPIKAYQSVGVNTEAIVNRLQSLGIQTQFDWVPGAHISNPMPRAERAFDYLYSNNLS